MTTTRLLLLATYFLLFSAGCTADTAEAQARLACGVDADETARLMSLDYQAFDQDFDGGWRAVAYRDGCEAVAVGLIEDYLAAKPELSAEDQHSLRWHAGQGLASVGDYDAAESYFEQSYLDDPKQAPWNLYVDATLGFIRRDRAAVQAAHDALAAMPVGEEVQAARQRFLDENPDITMPDGFVTEPQNLSVVRNFLQCFDETYEVAYGHCGSDEHGR